MNVINVLFLCTGNSCRSIMAEVLLNNMNKTLGKNKFMAYSAGSYPTGQVNEDAIRMLDKNHLSYHGLISKSWDAFEGINFDIVITVCDNAANETCPMYLGKAIKAHWGIPDPDKVIGNKRMKAFKLAYEQLKHRIVEFLALSNLNSKSINQIGKLPL